MSDIGNILTWSHLNKYEVCKYFAFLQNTTAEIFAFSIFLHNLQENQFLIAVKISLCNLQNYKAFPTQIQISLDTAPLLVQASTGRAVPVQLIFHSQTPLNQQHYSVTSICFSWHGIICNPGLQRSHQSLGNHTDNQCRYCFTPTG